MALKGVFRRGGSAKKSPPPTTIEPEATAPAKEFADMLKHGISFPEKSAAKLSEGFRKGVDFFDEYNTSRLELAFESFEEDMLHGLFEIIYLLNFNYAGLADWKYQVRYKEEDKRSRQKKQVDKTANLYVEGAPAGVQGFDSLPEIFREEFEKYTQSVFGRGRPAAGNGGHSPTVSLHSIGSIGTVGHKSVGSDLDLQVIYSLEPYSYDTENLSDQMFKDAMKRESGFWMRDFAAKNKISMVRLRDPRIQKRLQGMATREMEKNYPTLFRYLVSRKGDTAQDFGKDSSPGLRMKCVHEMINLMKRFPKLLKAGDMKEMEEKYRERVDCIQEYITAKFPSVEIYMFPMSIDNYRRGIYSSTLEFKESSGSAYELILNQETLMPGIQFTRVMPSHFVFPEEINNYAAKFNRLNDYIRFQAVDLFDSIRDRLVNLGSSGDLPPGYIPKHSGAVYWEAFKASSGNLPKAFLNLLRYEMLLQKRYMKTVIQLIKEPDFLDPMASPEPEKSGWPAEEGEEKEDTPIANWELLEIEEQFPKLGQDPWWLRYKALKIGFAEKNGVAGLVVEERLEVSRILDLSFALHVRISDIFTKPGSRREFKLHREKVLNEFLRRAFPKGSGQLKQVEQIFTGEMSAVNQFEEDLRVLFKASLKRVRKKIAAFGMDDKQKGQEEFDIWYHYYKENFDPKPNMVQRSIMNHLKVARGRLQLGYHKGEGWFFKSLQRESGFGKRFDTFGFLDHLPDEVSLQKDVPFLMGLAHCIINGYYGVLHKGTLRERQTAVEFNGKFLDQGNKLHNSLAFLRPDQLERILKRILAHFPYQDYDYLDIIREERKATEVFIFLNMWEFGRLSILSRDNLRAYFCDEFEHPGMLKNATELSNDADEMFSLPALQSSLGSFFDTRKILMDAVDIAVWVNPNSVQSNHGANQIEQKEAELAKAFERAIHDYHDN